MRSRTVRPPAADLTARRNSLRAGRRRGTGARRCRGIVTTCHFARASRSQRNSSDGIVFAGATPRPLIEKRQAPRRVISRIGPTRRSYPRESAPRDHRGPQQRRRRRCSAAPASAVTTRHGYASTTYGQQLLGERAARQFIDKLRRRAVPCATGMRSCSSTSSSSRRARVTRESPDAVRRLCRLAVPPDDRAYVDNLIFNVAMVCRSDDHAARARFARALVARWISAMRRHVGIELATRSAQASPPVRCSARSAPRSRPTSPRSTSR